MGNILGIAKRGFGMLKKGKKGVDHKKRLQVFKKASESADYDQTVKKAKKLIKEGNEAIKKRMMTRHPLTDIPEGKKWAGRINPDGSHVRPKKAGGGIVKTLKTLNKLKGVHGGKGMVALGAGGAGTALWARSKIKKFEREVEEAGGLDAYINQQTKKFSKKGKKSGPRQKKKLRD